MDTKMNELEKFVKTIESIANNSEELSIENQRRIVFEINRFLFCTHNGIGQTTELDGEQFQLFSDYHKYWKENYVDILSLYCDDEQCSKVADVLHSIYVKTEGRAFEEVYETYGLSRNQIFLIRILTANQDFNGSRNFKELADIYLEKPDIFIPDTIIDRPGDFISALNFSTLSQTDKRIDFAKNIAAFVKKYGSEPDVMLESFGNDVFEFRKALINNSNTGYGNKKTDMFIRDMVQTNVWENVAGFDKIDVASDANTIKIAMKTGILKSSIPLLSSFMDIFCYQYGHVDLFNAKAWRRVWEIWCEKYPNECVSSPCQMDYLIYNLIGRKICKNSLTEYICNNCGASFYWHNSMKRVCPECKSHELRKQSSLPCKNENGKCVIKNLAKEKNLFLKEFNNCPFIDICNNGGNLNAASPKSISIKGQTGWTSAYANEANGGGGLMA